MFNMDMVGQGNGDIGIGGINEFPMFGETMFSSWPDSALKPLEFWGRHGGSDHAAFRDAGIPSYIIGARGDHPNYHTPYDTSGAIKPDVLKAVGDMAFHCVENLANYPQPLSPQVSKAGWLNWRSGGIKFASLRSPYQSIHTQLDVVDYPQPLLFVNIDPYKRNSKTKSDNIFSGLENVRTFAAEHLMPFLADSLHKDYKGSSFKGVTVFVSANLLPSDPAAYKAMARQGLSFTDITGMAGSNFPLSQKTINRLEQLSEKCKPAGIRPMLYNSPVDMTIKVAKIFKGQLIVRYDADKFDFKRLNDLAAAGCFVILEGGQLTNPESLTAITESIVSLGDSKLLNNIGCIASQSLVESLLEAGLERNQIEDLLIENLCVQLRDWWGESQ